MGPPLEQSLADIQKLRGEYKEKVTVAGEIASTPVYKQGYYQFKLTDPSNHNASVPVEMRLEQYGMTKEDADWEKGDIIAMMGVKPADGVVKDTSGYLKAYIWRLTRQQKEDREWGPRNYRIGARFSSLARSSSSGGYN